MYILTEKENNKLNFYSETGDGVKLFQDLNSLRATVETLQDAERELFGDLKTEFGYIKFDAEDIMTLQDEFSSPRINSWDCSRNITIPC